MNGLKYPDDIPHMGETYSVLQAAATWLGMNGVKNIITCGVGDLEGGYHPMFEYDWISPDISKQGGVWDPAAAEEARTLFSDRIQLVSSPYDALHEADALVIHTEWHPYRHPDFARMKSLMAEPLIFDGRNIYDPETMIREGFEYHSIGRITVGL